MHDEVSFDWWWRWQCVEVCWLDVLLTAGQVDEVWWDQTGIALVLGRGGCHHDWWWSWAVAGVVHHVDSALQWLMRRKESGSRAGVSKCRELAVALELMLTILIHLRLYLLRRTVHVLCIIRRRPRGFFHDLVYFVGILVMPRPQILQIYIVLRTRFRLRSRELTLHMRLKLFLFTRLVSELLLGYLLHPLHVYFPLSFSLYSLEELILMMLRKVDFTNFIILLVSDPSFNELGVGTILQMLISLSQLRLKRAITIRLSRCVYAPFLHFIFQLWFCDSRSTDLYNNTLCVLFSIWFYYSKIKRMY